MAEEDPDRRRGDRSGKEGDDDGVDVDEKAPPPRRTSRRVASLDVFRGLTVALMILVDGAGGEWPVIGHAPWNGCNLADFVMPFFLFIVGMAIPLSLKVLRSLVFHLSSLQLCISFQFGTYFIIYTN